MYLYFSLISPLQKARNPLVSEWCPSFLPTHSLHFLLTTLPPAWSNHPKEHLPKREVLHEIFLRKMNQSYVVKEACNNNDNSKLHHNDNKENDQQNNDNVLTCTVGGSGRFSSLVARSRAPARATIFSAGVATKHPSSVSRADDTRRSTAVRGNGAEEDPPNADDSPPLLDEPVPPDPLTAAEKSSGSSGQPKSSLVFP